MSWNGVAKGGEFIGACTSGVVSGFFLKASVTAEDVSLWVRIAAGGIGLVAGIGTIILMEDFNNGDKLAF